MNGKVPDESPPVGWQAADRLTRAGRAAVLAYTYKDSAGECLAAHVHLGAVILAGAAFESGLLALVLADQDRVKKRWPESPDEDPDRWALGTLIQAGRRMGWLRKWQASEENLRLLDPTGSPSPDQALLTYRNWIHPRRLLSSGRGEIDFRDALAATLMLDAAVDELLSRLMPLLASHGEP